MLTAPNMPSLYHAPASRYPFLPSHIVQQGFSHTTHFSKGEKRVLRKKIYQKPSEWVPKNRKLTQGDFAGHYMSFDYTPHLRGILDAIALPFIREAAICAAPQTAKTTGIDSFVAWTREFDRGPVCSFYPDETTGKRAMRERIKPLVSSSHTLSKLMVRGRNNATDTTLRMVGGNWEVGWAGSTAQTADRPLKIVDMQEINKPAYGKSGEETGAVFLLRDRVRSFRGHKIIMSSTPTVEEGNITVIVENECEAVFVQWVRCPHCHEEIFMHWHEDRFYPLDQGEDEAIDRLRIKSKKLGRYICQSCGTHLDDEDRNRAIRRETWRKRILDDNGEMITDQKGEEMFRYLKRERPASIGFILPSWMSYMVSLSDVVHDYLRTTDAKLAEDQRLKSRKAFANAHCAAPWKVDVELRKSDELLRLKDDRPEGIVPGGNRVACLLAGIDTQDDGLWFWIYARGYGKNPHRWLVRCGFVTTMEAVREALFVHEYKDVAGNIYPVRFALQDAMGHFTSEVYDFCESTHGLILPIKGERTLATPYASKPVEFYPGPERRPFLGALRRIHINSTFYKDKADGILKTGRDDLGGLAFHADIQPSHIDQLCAEVRDEHGFWENPKRRHNHLWDCMYLGLCAEDIMGVKYWPEPGQEIEEESDVQEVVTAQMG